MGATDRIGRGYEHGFFPPLLGLFGRLGFARVRAKIILGCDFQVLIDTTLQLIVEFPDNGVAKRLDVCEQDGSYPALSVDPLW
jgi:hypothetical protein